MGRGGRGGGGKGGERCVIKSTRDSSGKNSEEYVSRYIGLPAQYCMEWD